MIGYPSEGDVFFPKKGIVLTLDPVDYDSSNQEEVIVILNYMLLTGDSSPPHSFCGAN